MIKIDSKKVHSSNNYLVTNKPYCPSSFQGKRTLSFPEITLNTACIMKSITHLYKSRQLKMPSKGKRKVVERVN